VPALLRVFLLLLGPALSQAATLPLVTGESPLLPDPCMQVWSDPPGQADIQAVRQLPDSAWQDEARRDASFGYSGYTYWLRITVHNLVDQPIN
jgi:diguanylate cyclase